MDDWREITIGDVCESVSMTYNGTHSMVVLINTSDVLEGRVLNHTPVLNQHLKGQFKKTFRRNDILYSEIRPANRRYAFVDFDRTDNYIASTKLMVIRPNKELVLPRFLYAILTSKSIVDELQLLAETRSGTFPQITFGAEVATRRIWLPSLTEQEKIVAILDAIESKIQTNVAINDNLEQQAAAMFREMFITHADPSWAEGTISDLGTVVGGSTPSKAIPEYYTEHGIAWITPKDLSVDKSKFISHGADDITELGLRNSSASILPEGTVLFSSRAPIGYIAIADGEVTTNQGFKSVVPHAHVGTAFVYYFLKGALPIIEGMASGSTFKEISGSAMRTVPAIVPDEATLHTFSSFCDPLFLQQRSLERQNRELAAMRDALLPKLMSGEIDVSSVTI